MTDKVTHYYKAIPRTAFDKRAVKKGWYVSIFKKNNQLKKGWVITRESLENCV